METELIRDSHGSPHAQGNALRWEMAIALGAVAIFITTLGFGWVYDDQMEIVLNPLIRSLDNLPKIFTTTVWAGSGMETYLYRPLALVTYSLNHIVSGLAPWSYHLVNVLLHAGVSVMVFRLGRNWGLPVFGAGVGGILFAVHPVHVEVVAAVFGRKDLLAAFFILAMVLLHDTAAKRGGWRIPLPVLAYALAMLSKEVGVVGVALVAVQDWFLSPDRSRLARDGRRAGLYVAYLATLLIYVLVRNGVTGGVSVPETSYLDNPLVAAPIGSRLATAVAVMGKGMALLLLPLTLSPDYSFDAIPLVRSPLDWRLLGTLAVFAAVVWGLLRARSAALGADAADRSSSPDNQDRSVPLRGFSPFSVLMVALLWYLVCLLPSANVLVTVGTIFGERLLYLPSVSFSLLVGWGLGWLVWGTPGGASAGKEGGLRTRWIRSAAVGGITLWTGMLAVRTLSYSSAWRDDVSLFRHAVASIPNSTKAHHKLGEELLRAGEIGSALPHLRRALEIAPDNAFAARTLEAAHQYLARLYLQAGPGGTPQSPPPDPEILYALGQISRTRGDLTSAEAYWEAALAADSTHAPSQVDLGALQVLQGDTASALAHLRAGVRLEPDLANGWLILGRLYLARGDVREAGEALGAFIRRAGPRFPEEVRWAREVLAGLPSS